MGYSVSLTSMSESDIVMDKYYGFSKKNYSVPPTLQLSGHLIFTPPGTPAIFLHSNVLYNNAYIVIGAQKTLGRGVNRINLKIDVSEFIELNVFSKQNFTLNTLTCSINFSQLLIQNISIKRSLKERSENFSNFAK